MGGYRSAPGRQRAGRGHCQGHRRGRAGHRPAHWPLSRPLTALGRALFTGGGAFPMPGEVAVIYGAGAIGLLFLAVLGAGGVRCGVAEPVARRREAARLMGAAATVDPATADVRATVSALQPGGADLAVDAVGSQFGAAVAEVRPGGGVLLFGMNSQARSAIAQNDITRREITVYGAYVG